MTKRENFERLMGASTLGQDLRGKSVRAVAYTGTASVIDFVVRIVSTAILARLLLPEHFGVVMMVTAITSIAEQIRDLGLSTATVQRKTITHEEVTNLFWINLGAGALIALIFCGLSPLVAHYYQDPRLQVITCVLSFTFLFGGAMAQHQALLTRQLKLGQTSLIRLAASVLSTILAIALAWSGFGYWALLWREFTRILLVGIGMWVFLPWIPSWPRRNTDVRELLRFGANLSAANILASISAGFDRFLLGRFAGAGAVGVYRQSFQLVAAPTDQLLSPFYQVAQPTLSMLQSDAGRYRRFFTKLVTIVCLLTMPLSLFAAVYATEITLLLLGPRWLSCAPLLCILSFGTFIKQAVGSTAFVLITRGRADIYFRLTMLHNVTLIALMCIGVRWGLHGVAIADVTATFLLIGPRLYCAFNHSPVNVSDFLRALAHPAIASLAMAYALLGWKSQAAVATTAGELAFGVLVAVVTFGVAWILLPGGRAVLQATFSDVRSSLRRPVVPKPAIEAVASAN